MIGRLLIFLNFKLDIPDGETFSVYRYQIEGYEVRFYPPMRSDRLPPRGNDASQVKIDGVEASQTDVLRIDFYKEDFDRRIETYIDPPEKLINEIINFFIIRLRHVGKVPQIKAVNFPLCDWRIQYLNDDGTDLEKMEGYVRTRFTSSFSLSCIALTKKVWDSVHGLESDYSPPPWESLLLDADADLPSIGPSIVLAATALEVFISKILDQMAAY
jgi:hypothetical protein